MRILIIALSGNGDALMFSPALRLLRENHPDAEIDLLCMFKGVKELYQHNPFLTKLIHFNFMSEGAVNSLKFVFSLRNKYDVSINVYPANRREYNIISFLINAEKRLAINYLRNDFFNFGFLNNHTIKEDDSLHNVEENTRMVEKLLHKKNLNPGSMEIYFDKNTQSYADDFIRINLSSDKEQVIGIHAGCATMKNHIMRRWEPEKFASLIQKLKQHNKFTVLLFGGPDEFELNESIARLSGVEVIQVRTDTLLQTAAIMRKCNVFVTNDSALMHLASALSLKIVAIIGPTNINYIHPWRTEYKIASLGLECQPCFFYSPKPLKCSRTDMQFRCIKELGEEEVFQLVQKII